MKRKNSSSRRPSQAQIMHAFSIISRDLAKRSNLSLEQLAASVGLHQTEAMPDLLPAKDAAAFLGLSVKTMANWRVAGEPKLPFVKHGSRIAYRRDELMKFIEQRALIATSESNSK